MPVSPYIFQNGIRDPQIPSSSPQLNIRFGRPMKIRTAGWKQSVGFRQRAKLPAFLDMIGRMPALHPIKSQILQIGKEGFRLVPAKPALAGMRQDRKPPGASDRLQGLFRENRLSGTVIGTFRIQILPERLIHRRNIAFL